MFLLYIFSIIAINMGACTGTSNKQSTPSSALAQVFKPKQMTCNICTEAFNLNGHEPIMLCQNQHNVCSSCVKKLQTSQIGECPFCRIQIDFATTTKNRILMEILEDNSTCVSSRKQIEETNEQKIDRILKEARRCNAQRVIYYIEVGIDLGNVKQMHLWGLGLSTFLDLSIFPNLKTLDLHKNKIQEISKNIEQFEQLTYLNLGYNEIKKIDNLERLAQLEFLDLSHNLISKIENLANLKKLSTLNLNFNQIAIIENLYMLPKLLILYLSTFYLIYNKILSAPTQIKDLLKPLLIEMF